MLGGYAGWKLSFFPDFQAFKLYAIIGIAFDIVGVVLLTYLVTTNDKLKEWISRSLALAFVKAFGYIPIAILFVSSVALGVFDAPSAEEVIAFVLPIMFLMIIPIFSFEDVVIYKRFTKFKSVDARIKFLGGFFLIAGLLLQLFAAIKDFAGE